MPKFRVDFFEGEKIFGILEDIRWSLSMLKIKDSGTLCAEAVGGPESFILFCGLSEIELFDCEG